MRFDLSMKAALAATALLAGAQGAVACEIPLNQPILDALIWLTKPETRNQSVVVAADCGFEKGGRFDKLSGTAVGDAGRGIIAQGLKYAGGRIEHALVVDCNSKVFAVLSAPETMRFQTDCGFDHVEYGPLLKPEGPMSLREGGSFDELLKIAEQRGVAVDMAPPIYMPKSIKNDVKLRDRVDPYCGCKLFYPESAGAS